MRPLALLLACLVTTQIAAQQAPQGQTPPPSPRAAAPVDLTGSWVSVVSEDWQWRMVTPPKGDYASLPLNAAATRVADAWNPAEDGSCKAYGAAAIMRMPGRLRISWENDSTLKIETDAGVQTRRLRFNAAPPPPTLRDAQGYSVATWEIGAGGRAPWGSLKVVTTNMRAGWLRRNGVPYSDNAVMTEHFDRFSDGVDEWFTVTTVIEDPAYLTQPLVVSSNFKKEQDGAKWAPRPCKTT